MQLTVCVSSFCTIKWKLKYMQCLWLSDLINHVWEYAMSWMKVSWMDESIVDGWVSREYICGYVMDECIVDGWVSREYIFGYFMDECIMESINKGWGKTNYSQ